MSEKIIQFPGAKALPSDEKPVLPLKLTEDQQKAIGCITSGMTFVFIGIKPSDSGADFFTALHGDHTDLRNAQDHLLDVIGRLYDRKGITS